MKDLKQLLALHEANKAITFNGDYEYDYEYDSAEMYSNSNMNKKKKGNLNKNTFQQSSVNVRGQAPAFPSQAQAPECREVQEIPENRYGRRFSFQNDKITEMHIQLGHPRIGTRTKRMKAYISIKTESDRRYMIFMRSALTSAIDETYRSIQKDCDKVLESEADIVYKQHHNDNLYMGRVKYKPTKGQPIQKHHRKNLPVSLLSVYTIDKMQYAEFYFLDQTYTFILDEQISEKQKPYYSAQGTWYLDEGTLSISEAFQ